MDASEVERLGRRAGGGLLRLRADGEYISRGSDSEDHEVWQEWTTRRLWQKDRNDCEGEEGKRMPLWERWLPTKNNTLQLNKHCMSKTPLSRLG